MKKFLIVAHDAGGAEIISSWVKHNPDNNYSFILEGPAVKIFENKVKNLIKKSSLDLETAILSSDQVLTGTSWNSNLENEAIHFAVKNKIKVISYLEHWVNFSERFIYNNILELPDEIWVGDIEAYKIAVNIFPEEKIKLVPNLYFLDMKNEIENLTLQVNLSNKLTILYLCEPIAKAAFWRYGNEKYFGYDEFDALRYFFSCLQNSKVEQLVEKIIIRPHPSEEQDKYKTILTNFNFSSLEISANSLAQDCAVSNWIVGCTSMALVVCLFANKQVFNCIPIENPIYKLPFNEIKDFREGLIALSH